jgi:hypothetical protein
MPMTAAPSGVPHPPSQSPHPLRTIRDIRDSLPEDQRRHFDTELADTEIEALPEMLHRWVTLSNDGFDTGRNRTRASWPGSGPRPGPTAS